MPFRRSFISVLAAFAFLLSFAAPSLAQDGDGTPTEGTGTLRVTAAACAEGGEPGTVLFDFDAGIAAGATCTPADISISIDGGEALGVSGNSVFSLDAGSHSLTDLETGQTLAVEIAADAQTAVERVAFIAAPTEAPTETPVATETPTPIASPTPGQITITMHRCPPTIVNKDAFTALGGFDQQMAACPSILLPGNGPMPGTVGGAEASFDLQMATGSGDTAQTQSLAGSTFTPGSRCETDAGFDLDNDGQLATCFDLSGYNLSYSTLGLVVITLGPLPPDSRLGAAGFIPNSGDEQTLRRTTKEGIIELDTTGDDDVHLNIFLFSKPPTPTPAPPTATATPKPTLTATPKPTQTVVPTATPSPTPSPTQPSGGAGTMQAIALYCTADIDAARLTILPPGQEAGGADLGDSTCIGGNATFDLYKGGNFVASVSTGVPGVAFLSNLETGSYTVIDRKSGASGDATIANGMITRSILLSFAATVGDAGSGGLVDDGTGGSSGPTISVGGGLVNDGGLGGGAGSNGGSAGSGSAAGGSAAPADDDSTDTESVASLVAVGTGPANRSSDLALPLAGLLLILLLAGWKCTRVNRS